MKRAGKAVWGAKGINLDCLAKTVTLQVFLQGLTLLSSFVPPLSLACWSLPEASVTQTYKQTRRTRSHLLKGLHARIRPPQPESCACGISSSIISAWIPTFLIHPVYQNHSLFSTALLMHQNIVAEDQAKFHHIGVQKLHTVKQYTRRTPQL